MGSFISAVCHTALAGYRLWAQISKVMSNKNRKLRIVILSQDDSFVIPKNIMKLNELDKVDIVSIFTLNTKGSFSNT